MVDCSLTLTVGDRLIKLECTCPPGAEYGATNSLMEEMRSRIKAARHKEITKTDDLPWASRN